MRVRVVQVSCGRVVPGFGNACHNAQGTATPRDSPNRIKVDNRLLLLKLSHRVGQQKQSSTKERDKLSKTGDVVKAPHHAL